MVMLSRVNGWLGPTGRKYKNPFNAGTGGTEQTYTKSNGEIWKSHTFTGTSTFNVTSASNPFTVLVLSGGQGGGYCHPADCRPDGAAGPAKVQSITATEGVVNVTVGAGGGGGAGTHQSGAPGGASSFGAYLTSTGGGSVTTDVKTGTNQTWAGNGYGAGGAACYLCTGATGQPGIVVIGYRIG